MVMKVVLIYRKSKKGAYSIEELFHTIAGELGKQVEVIEYEAGSRWHILKDLWRLRKINADIYHVVGDVHYFVMLLPQCKTVLTIHDIYHYLNDLSGIKRFIYKWIWLLGPLRYAGAVTVISNTTRDNIINNFGFLKKHINVIENCHSSLIKPVVRAFNAACPLILHLGTQPHKNVPRLIQALSGIDCQLILIGKVNSSLKQQLIDNKINYISRSDLTHEEICQQYRDSDIVSFVSLAEGFGMPIIEAQATGRPLITSNVSPMREVAGEGACLVDPLDISTIRESILKIVADSDYRGRLVENGLRNVVRFSPTNISDLYLNLYKRIRRF